MTLEEEYRESLYYQDFKLALALLERLGEMHCDHVDESVFWKELYFAARHLELPAQAEKYKAKLEQLSGL